MRPVKTRNTALLAISLAATIAAANAAAVIAADLSYPVVDTNQTTFYDNETEIDAPLEGEAFYGQDASYEGIQSSYTDNGDGTVTDDNTGLMWAQSAEQNLSYDEAVAGAETYDLADYDDWRLPAIKELYSLMDFSGTDPICGDDDSCEIEPFIDTDVFDFEYGDESAGERLVDVQYVSSTVYAGDGDFVFGVNFADGRIKGYGLTLHGQDKEFDVLYVRGVEDYGVNDFSDNSDGTISDMATGLTWTQTDNGEAILWEDALTYCESLDTAEIDDWRLPNAKELQSLVDYTRSPDTTGSPAIDALFELTGIEVEDGTTDYPFLWSGTTHATPSDGEAAAYVAFGESKGWSEIDGEYVLEDVHGAGAQRSDPKTGDAADYPYGDGPQGDVVRIENYAVCVTDTE